MDGNKRTALAACLVFLDANGLLPNDKLPIDECAAFVLDVASSRVDREEAMKRLGKLISGLNA